MMEGVLNGDTNIYNSATENGRVQRQKDLEQENEDDDDVELVSTVRASHKQQNI